MLLLLESPTASAAALSGAGRYFRKVLSASALATVAALFVGEKEKVEPSPGRSLSRRLVHALVAVLRRYDLPEVQMDATWALTNVASGPQKDTHMVNLAPSSTIKQWLDVCSTSLVLYCPMTESFM